MTNESNGSGNAPDPLKLLQPQHLDDLRRSGLSDECIAACRFRSIIDPKQIDRILGWRASAKEIGPCLAIPFAAADGTINGYARLKPDKPRPAQKDGSPVRYESPRGKGNRAFFPPNTRAALADATIPLIIVEGEKKAAKGDQSGFPTIGLVGVYGWMKKREEKEAPRELIADLEAVTWHGRPVFLCYDSDLATKRDVAFAEWYLAETLAAKGAAIKVVRLPGGADGDKIGLDDYLISHSTDDFRALLAEAQPPSRPVDTRPEIELGPLEFIAVDSAIDALAAKDRDIYQRGGQLVRVARPCQPSHHRRLTTSAGPKIEAVPTPALRTRLTRVASIVEFRQQDGKPVKMIAHPPDWLTKGVLSAGVWPGIRPLEAVVGAPVLLPDGSVLQRPGYHRDSGLLYEPEVVYPRIPDRPSRDDARRAMAELLEPVENFPFKTPAHRSGYVAGVLTPLARFAFQGPSPFFLVDANVRGAGKGLLADLFSWIALGREFARAVYSLDDAEMGKTITAIAHAGERMILFDNLGGFLGNPSLDAALTTTQWQGRILGKSEQPRVPLLTSWYGTGNNVILLADTTRRVCPIRLESPDERPENRSGFRHPDLLGWVRDNRGRLLTAALTILSAYCRAGRPDQKLKPWGSYPEWSALVRGAIVWAGQPDPEMAREELAAKADTEAGNLRGLIVGWQEIDPEAEGKTAAWVVNTLAEAGKECYPALREVLADVFDLPQGKLPTGRKLGNKLNKWAGRNVGGLCFDSRTAHGGVKAWFVRHLHRDGGSGGSAVPIDAPKEGSEAPASPKTEEYGASGGSGGSVLPTFAGVRDADDIRVLEERGYGPTRPTRPTTTGTTADGTPFIVVTDAGGLEAVSAALTDTAIVGLDTETTGLNPRTDRLRLLTITTDTCDGGRLVYIVDAFHVDLRPLWEALAERPIVAHNATFDLGFLAVLGFIPGVVHDTMILSQLVHGTRHARGFHGLGQVVERELARPLDKTEQKSDWSGDLTPEQLAYAAADAAVLPDLYVALTAKVKAGGLSRVADIERRCLPAMTWLCQSGAPLDVDGWETLAREADEEAKVLADKLGAAAPLPGSLLLGEHWNWDSPAQVKEVFAALGVSMASTDDDALAAVNHPLAELIRQYRSKGKLAGTYGLSWYGDALQEGRVYAGWKQIGADSGRMACASPNLQNVSRDPRYRRCFRAPAGRVLVKADYSQVELRIAAKIAGEKAMLDAYTRGEDLHRQTARKVLGIEDVTKQHRQLAKALNFGLLYGMGAKNLRVYAQSQYGVDLTHEEARDYRKAFFDAYPRLAHWHRSITDGSVDTRTLTGRRRASVTRFTEKLNSPVQGTGADGLKAALALLWERRVNCPGAFPILVVHDEIVVEADAEKADAAAEWLKAAMIDGMAPLIAPVPCEVKATISRTWAGD